MGIPAYFSHIIKNYSEISLKLDNFKKNKNSKVPVNFYLDCNSIIYDCARALSANEKQYTFDFSNKKDFENELIKHVFRKIEEYVREIKPDGTIFIAFDGVAPVAKLNQQRSRRFKSAYESKVLEQVAVYKWDNANITPGTAFMDFLSRKMKLHFGIKKRYIVSTSDDAGEGEHKIFDHIRSHGKHTINIVYGLDADLIMLSLCNLKNAPLIYLYRETPQYISSLHAELEPSETYLFNIPMLAKLICENNMSNDAIDDYVFLCFLLGNDFMPHIPSINIRHKGIYFLMNAYKKINCNLTTNGKIVWANVRKLLALLAQNEHENLINEYENRNKYEALKMKSFNSMTANEKYNMIPIFNREIEHLIDLPNPAWKSRYYKYLFEFNDNKSFIQNTANNYLEGLEWTFKYYTSGCPDWRRSYKYKYAPLLDDILTECHYFDYEYFNSNNSSVPISKQSQLIYVLPCDYHYLLEEIGIEEVYNKVMTLGIIEKNDTNALSFLWAFCTYIWESHIFLPKVDVNLLNDTVNNLINTKTS